VLTSRLVGEEDPNTSRPVSQDRDMGSQNSDGTGHRRSTKRAQKGITRTCA